MTGLEAPTIIAIVGATAAVAGAGVAIKGNLDAAKAAKRAAAADAERLRNQDKASQDARAANAKLQRKAFRIKAGKNETEASFSGGEGFGDLFRADVTTFESEQLILDFNRDVFGVNQQSQANLAVFQGDAFASSQKTSAIGTGISAVGAVATSFSGLTPGTPPQNTALGGSSSSAGFNAPFATTAKTSTFA